MDGRVGLHALQPCRWCHDEPQHVLALARAAGYKVWWMSNHDDLVIEQQHARLADVVSGGSQSFNAVNQLRVLGRWMRMITIPNQSSVAKAFLEFDEQSRMKPSSFYDRVVDVMEELVKFTPMTRGSAAYLVDRYSERKESAEQLLKRVNLRSV